jgi:hypothetical protein
VRIACHQPCALQRTCHHGAEIGLSGAHARPSGSGKTYSPRAESIASAR